MELLVFRAVVRVLFVVFGVFALFFTTFLLVVVFVVFVALVSISEVVPVLAVAATVSVTGGSISTTLVWIGVVTSTVGVTTVFICAPPYAGWLLYLLLNF